VITVGDRILSVEAAINIIIKREGPNPDGWKM
jgi:hypothetical protein